MSRRATIWISALLAGAVIAFAAYRAIRLAWLADDSFTTAPSDRTTTNEPTLHGMRERLRA